MTPTDAPEADGGKAEPSAIDIIDEVLRPLLGSMPATTHAVTIFHRLRKAGLLSDWQPIDTAPRDTPILLGSNDPDILPIVGRWDDGDRRRDPIAPGAGWFASSRYGGLLFTENGHEEILEADWWLPLPAPPKVTS